MTTEHRERLDTLLAELRDSERWTDADALTIALAEIDDEKDREQTIRGLKDQLAGAEEDHYEAANERDLLYDECERLKDELARRETAA